MNIATRKLVSAAAVGAAYAALTMLLAPISYGAVQFRVSEALCILPFFMPWTAWGLFIGCAVANVISTAGILDVVFGSLATLLACLAMAALGRPKKTAVEPATAQAAGESSPSVFRCVLACLAPVLSNGVIIGALLSYVLVPAEGFWAAFLLFGAQVAAGEAAVMLIIGLPLMRMLAKWKFFRNFSASYK